MLSRALAKSRYLVLIAVLGSALAAFVLVIYGGISIYNVIAQTFQESVSNKGIKSLALSFIEIIDVFLLATVFYIIAVGLYELFIDDKVPLLPAWLEIHTLDDLKNKLISVVIVVMGVLFLGNVVSWKGDPSILYLGAAVALMITALTYFLGQQKGK
jgi:uncharacterized membrane protein YqhA